MKDHSTKENNKTFILSYKIKNNKIYVKYANKDVVEYDYSKEKEDTIKSIMCDQVRSLKKDHNHFSIKLSLLLISLAILILIGTDFISVPIIFASLGTIGIVFETQRKISNKDVEKHVLFLDNKEVINEKVHDDNVLNNVSEKTVNLVNSNKKIDINHLDLIKLRDIKTILTNIERNSIFEEEKPKIKINNKL